MIKFFYTNKQFLDFDFRKLESKNISEETLSDFFPNYILHPKVLKYGLIKRFLIVIIKKVLEAITWTMLRPRMSKVGDLDIDEVDKVYTKEAKSYNLKHHITTRGMDLVWRRSIGWFLGNNYINNKEKIKILDLCTGTGLVAKEIAPILRKYNTKADIIGLDYNKEMLSIARLLNREEYKNVKLEFARGDATQLSAEQNKIETDLISFDLNSFDAVIQMFGVGGIKKPLKSFNEILKVLKEGGCFFMTDIHRPIPEFPGEFPVFFIKWLKMPTLESVLYEETTMPLVLNRLWGWRDTTLLFYLIGLVTYKDNHGNLWGFQKIYFDYDPQRWWFSLPFMPVAKMVVKKIRINDEDLQRRSAILKFLKVNRPIK